MFKLQKLTETFNMQIHQLNMSLESGFTLLQ